MSHNSIDYFATLGRKDGNLSCKNLFPIGVDSDDQNRTVHPSEIWGNAVTDIEIIYKDAGESVRDSTWELIELTIDKTSADCLIGVPALGSVFIAVQRRRNSQRIDHICDIAVVYMGESIPEGYEAIEKSISGEVFFDNGSSIPRTRLALRRAGGEQALQLIQGSPLIDDICLVNRSLNEFEPEDYIVIDKCLQNPKSWGGHSMVIAYHRREALGLCDLQYESATMDRFPQQDHNGLALPVDELPMFVFPHGLQLKYCTRQCFPLPDFFTFVFTDVLGRHLYTTCLRFYEVIPHDEIQNFFRSMYGEDKHICCDDGMDVFSPKVICVVSQFPFYRAMGRFLKQLYSLSLSRSFFPIEHFIASVVSQIPVPVPGGRPLYVVLDAALISHSSRSMQPIKFELPPKCFFPPMDLDFSGPMRCLSLDHILAIFCLLLQEQKIIFICASNALLTDVMETFRALLFPLTWSTCFVTRLPDLLSGLLQAPGGFMIGLHMPPSQGTSSAADSNSSTGSGKRDDDMFRNHGAGHVWTSSLQGGTYIVDLSDDKLIFFDGKEKERLSAGKISSILRTLPGGPLQRLQSKLSNIAQAFRLCPQDVGHAQFDSVFEFQTFDADELPAGVTWSDFPTMDVRDAFLRFMADLLGDYSRYIVTANPAPASSVAVFQTFRELFAVEDYQRDADKSAKNTLECLMETQMFVNLIQERQEVPSHHLLFFDKAVKRLKDLNLSSLPADNRHNPKYRQQAQPRADYKVDASTPLYEHVLVLDSRDASFLLPSDVICAELKSSSGLKKHRDLFLGSVTNFEHALSLDDRSDSHDMTEKSINRQEVAGKIKLHLDDFTQGPLIIPGPLLKERQIDRDGDGPTDREYIYDTLWPTFDHNLTAEVTQDAVRTELRRLRMHRKQVAEKADSVCALFLREEAERSCFKFNRRLLNAFRVPVPYDAKDTALLTSFSDECKAALSMTAGVFNVSLVMLSARALRKVSPARDVIQAMSILSHLDGMNILNQVDESAWRSLIIASNAIEDGYFKENLIRLLMASLKSAGVAPSVLTSSQGGAARPQRVVRRGSHHPPSEQLAAGSTTDEKEALDSFRHLEELGLAWFAQKIVPFASPPPGACSLSSVPHVSYYDSGPKSFQPSLPQNQATSTISPSAMRRFSNIFRKNTEQQLVHKVRRKSVKAMVASEESANFMRLSKRNTSYFCMQKPRGPGTLFAVPQFVPNNLVTDSTNEVLLTSIRSSDVENKVCQVRDIFNKIQKLKSIELSMKVAHEEKRAAVANASAHASRGEAVVMLRHASSLCNCNSEGSQVNLTTVYARVWTTSMISTLSSADEDVVVGVKTAPGLQASYAVAVSTGEAAEIMHEAVKVKVEDTAKDEIFVELFGDFEKGNAAGCVFDMSLGRGHFSVSTALVSGLSSLNLQLHSSVTGEAAAVVHLSVEVATVVDNNCDGARRISCQTSSESFFNANGGGSAPHTSPSSALSRGVSLGGAPESNVKKTWKERLSFGLYKDKGEADNDSSREIAKRAVTPPPPPVTKIDETVSESLAIKSSEWQGGSSKLDCVEPDTSQIATNNVKIVDDGVGRCRLAPLHEERSTNSIATTGETLSEDNDAETAANLRAEIQVAQQQVSRTLADVEILSRILIQNQKRAVAVFSCSPCAVCGHCMLDDEMMAAWAGFPALGGSGAGTGQQGGGRGVVSAEQDIVKSHAIMCVRCHAEVIPLLHIQQCGLAGSEGGGSDRSAPLQVLAETSVSYLSPFGVRYSMELAIAENGTEMLNPAWLMQHSPLLYWNLLWYSTRLDLPSGLLPHRWFEYVSTALEGPGIEQQHFHGPVVTGWRECVTQVKAKRTLCGESCELGLRDVFPGATEEHLAAAAGIAATVHIDSPGSFAIALQQAAQLSSVHSCFGETHARGLYLSFVMLMHLSNVPQLVSFQTNNLYLDLPKGTLFDRLYQESISEGALAEQFGATREELLSAVSSKCALSIRILFGLML